MTMAGRLGDRVTLTLWVIHGSNCQCGGGRGGKREERRRAAQADQPAAGLPSQGLRLLTVPELNMMRVVDAAKRESGPQSPKDWRRQRRARGGRGGLPVSRSRP